MKRKDIDLAARDMYYCVVNWAPLNNSVILCLVMIRERLRHHVISWQA